MSTVNGSVSLRAAPCDMALKGKMVRDGILFEGCPESETNPC